MSSVATPTISVCIANYNGEALLQDCLDSVLAQHADADVEVIVHDDASTDGSLPLLASRYPQVKVITSEENVGFCVANNRMAQAARGDYLLLLNNDAALDPGALEAFLAESARLGSAAILTLEQRDWDSGALVDRGCLLDPFYNPVPNLDPCRADVAYVIGACLWIPRTLWNELGGFPEWFGSLAEDMYLCCAARLRGVPVRCAEGSAYRHRQGASFGGNRADGGLRTTYRRRALSERNKTATLFACTPGWTMWPLLAAHVALLFVEGAAMSALRRDARMWRDIYWPVLPGTPAAKAQWKQLRENAQATRRTKLRTWWRVFTWSPRKLSLLRRYGLPKVR